MKVLCILPDLNKCNGIVSFIMNYYIYNQNIKYDFLIINDEISEEYKDIIEKNDDKIYKFGKIRIKSLFRSVKKIKEIYINNNYDIIYSHVLYTAWFFFYFAKKKKIGIRILHSHNTPNKNKNPIKELLYRVFTKISVGLSTEHFACSKTAGEFLFPKMNYYVIRNAIDEEKYLFNLNIRNDYRKKLNLDNNLVLIHVGRFREQKNHIFLLEVFKEILKLNSNSKLMLVGDGPMENKIKNYAKEINVYDNILFLEVRNDVENLLQAADVFLFPSLFEGLGIAAVEAQVANLPCILSENVPREVSFNNNVFFLSIDDEKKWAILAKKLQKTNRDYQIDILHNIYNIKSEAVKFEKLLVEIYKETNYEKLVKK